ncbi:MAG: lipid-A-disaccharide synthase [Oceanipulchritudo sp.]
MRAEGNNKGRHGLHLAPPREGKVDVLFIAGEHSGDQHAASIALELAATHPEWKQVALGGPALRSAGVQVLHDLTRDSVVGLVEVLRNYPFFRQLFGELVRWIGTHQPRIVVLVDYPGFNLRLAEALRRGGISRKGGGNVAVYQYVSPQIWAWKAGRRFKMAGTLDELGVIFPFEVACYADTVLPVRFVGHPFASREYRNPLRYDPEGPILLLPGSRKQAVARIFPLMVRAIRQLIDDGVRHRCVCLYPGDGIRYILEQELGRQHIPPEMITLRSVETGTTANSVLTSSGTMSLNCALAGIPGAVVYRAHPLTTWIGKRLVKVDWLGIANLVLGRELYPEYLQEAARPEELAARIGAILAHPEMREPFAEGAQELRECLGAEEAFSVPERLERLMEASSR